MERQEQKRIINEKRYPGGTVLTFIIVLCGMLCFQQAYATFGPATRYEAENGFNSMSSNSSANAGYSGSGYVTGLTQNGSETKFDKGFSSPTLVKLDIRYANGTGANVTNLALYIGSNQKVQDLVFPSTGSWTTWGTITVTYTQDPSWGSNITIKSTSSVSTSANIDYTDLSVDDGTGTLTVATPTFNPGAGTYTSAQTVTISTTTSGASIRYTTDGSTPTASSTLYSSPITVSTTQTVKAIGILSGSTNSSIGSAAYTINTATPTVSTPTFSPGAGTYTAAQSVSISTSTSGATIYYTTDGSTPTTSSSVYSSTINVGSTQTLNALATKSGSTNSAIGSASYTINTGGGGGTGTGTGNITREYFAGITGTAVSNLTSNTNYPNSPTSTSSLTSFESPTNVADNYGQRVKGYVTAPTTGSYTFWIAADDDAELWLSTDGTAANKVKIASVSGWTNSQEWTKYSTQTSASISLTAGTQYYIEALHKEGSGGDNLAVAWQVPGGSRVVIPGSALSTTLNGSGPTTVATPTFSPGAGTYTSAQTVTISTTTSGASIRYTTDGSTPTASSTLYSSPITVSSTQTVKAIGILSGSTNSAVGSAAYTINTTTPIVATPTFSPGAGTYTSTQTVTISTTTSGASIRYTTDGSAPTATSTLYSSPITVSSTQTVRAIGILSGSTNSSVGTAAYTINTTTPTVATPTISPGSGTYTSAQTVTISTTTSGASIRYTTDGSAPTATSTLYSSPITVSSNQTVKAIGILSGSTNSSIASATYTINTTPVTGQPGLIREIWTGITGTTVNLLTSNANYPNNPTSSTVITSFDAQEYGDFYGQRIKGYLAPTVTGSYSFWIASDDDSELWLSTSSDPANKVKIASVSGWTNPYQYGKMGSQASSSITLTAGNYYYIEALHKEDNGGDHVTVAWQVPGGSQTIITSANLVTAPPVPIPLPGAFSQTSPSNGATGVVLNPTFSWGASSDVVSYTLVVSTSSSFSNPVINQGGITATSYVGGGLSGTTTYYWKVTAVNSTGTKVASNVGLSFTTLTPPAPSAFTQTAPASGATGVSTYPAFSWASATNASTYNLVVSTSSSYSSPIINQTGLTATSYSAGVQFATSTVYYWKVTAVNSTGSTVATNAGISFTTSGTTGTTYFVSTSGTDTPGNGLTSGTGAWRTVAYAASQVSAGTGNKTISVGAGTFVETQCIFLPLGVNLTGAGVGSTTITANGALPPPAGVDASSNEYHLWADGSLIQLASPIYSGSNPRYGSPAEMISPTDGSQTLSGFSVDGHGKTVKVGVYVQNRSNVTMHHVNFKDFQQSGSVFTRGDMWWYEPLPDGKWMNNISIHDCSFTNAGSDTGEQVGNLCIGGIDGADIYNITINDNGGEGIKFAHVGHHRNTKIHDCYIRVPEYHAAWTEFMAMELWNTSYGNEVYNMDLNTWISLANFAQLGIAYDVTTAHPWNLKLHDNKIIDTDGTGGTETIEVALSGVEIYNNYFQDKPYYLALWGGSGWSGGVRDNHKIYIHHNIFANVNRPSNFGFGDGAAVFTSAPENDIKIQNNVFDNLGNALSLNGGSNINISNNVFLNSAGDDVTGGSGITFKNNLRYNAASSNPTWRVTGGADATNYNGTLPGFKNTGSRYTTYYQPASGSAFVVNKGIDVGYAFAGSSPDIGRWEFGLTSSREAIVAEETSVDDVVTAYPNPSTGLIKIKANPDVKILSVQISTTQGKTLLSKSAGELKHSEIDLSAYPNDIYILSVRHQHGVITKKIVLVK